MDEKERRKKATEIAPDKPVEFINSSSSWIFRLWQINLVITAMADSSAHTRRKQCK